MANKKITDLPSSASVAITDVMELSHDPSGAPVSQKITVAQLQTAVGGGLSGAGSPEGAVAANPGAPYLDTVAESVWFKKTGTGNTGWIQLIV